MLRILQILRISVLTILLSLFFSSGAALAQGCPPADGVSRVNGQLECLVIQTTNPANIQKARNLLVYLHGDSSRGGLFDRHLNISSLLQTTTPCSSV